MGHFGHLVRYLYVGISPRRRNRFSICLLIWTQLEPYLNPCKKRFVSFSRFREIGQDTYGHFDLLVTGTFHVSTCEMLKINVLTARIGSLNSIYNGESPHIYFVWGFPRSRGSIFTLQMTPPPTLWFGAHNVVIHLWNWVKLTNCVNRTGLIDPMYATFACHVTYLIIIIVWALENYYLLLLY